MVSLARKRTAPRTRSGLDRNIVEDVWLTRVMGLPAFRLGPRSLGRALPRPSFAYVKVDASDTQRVCALQKEGFSVIDVNMTFRRAASASTAPDPEHAVEKADSPKWRTAAMEIAGSCFRFSRFHLDPYLDIDVAHRIKREWVRSYVEGQRGHGLYVALDNGRPQGFLAVILGADRCRRQAVIDLIGVAKAAQGRGIGRSLMLFFIQHYGPLCDELVVGTQAANIPSMRLYESCGFRTSHAAFVLHRHAR